MSDKKPDDDPIGQTIAGPYRIIARLGAGGMGVAYRASDETESLPAEEGRLGLLAAASQPAGTTSGRAGSMAAGGGHA